MLRAAIYLFVVLFSLLLTACGGGGSDSSAKTTTPVSKAPIANNDTVSINVNEAADINVLANDSGSTINVDSMTTPTNGTVINNSNTLSYTPNADFIGRDSFSYTIKDSSGLTASAVIEVNVNNVAPTAVNDNFSTNQSASLAIDVAANDSSQGNHQLTVISTSTPASGVINQSNGVMTYQPNLGFVGQDAFVYVIRDTLGDESTATVAITVNNVEPVAVNDAVNSPQNEPLTITPLSNDTDALGDELSITGISTVSNGSATLDGDTITYTPNDGFAGSDSLTYTIVDNFGATSEATITLDIVNQSPVANDDSVKVFKNNNIVIDVLSNDEDVKGDTLALQSVSTPLKGSAAIVEGKITYVPETDFTGDVVFGYTLVDSFNASASGVITVTVNNGITVKGKLIDFEKLGTTVTLNVGEQQFSGVTDSNGEFAIVIDDTDKTSTVIAHTENVTDGYAMYAYLGDVARYLTQMDVNFTIAAQNLSNITTAEYSFLNFIQKKEAKGFPIKKAIQLDEARSLVNTDVLLELAISINLINISNGIELPNEYTSINHFLQTPYAVQKQLSFWREQQPTEYYSAYSALFENNELTSPPDSLIEGDNLLIMPSYSDGAHFYSRLLALNSDNTGFYRSLSNAFVWQKNLGSTLLTYTNPNNTTYRRYYCGSKGNVKTNFASSTVRIKRLRLAINNEIFIQQHNGQFYDTNCFEGQEHKIEYNTLRKSRPLALSLNAGRYHFESIRAGLSHSKNEYDLFPGTFDLAEDGSFIETISESFSLTPRVGTWKINTEGHLQLNYDDGIVVYFNNLAHFSSYEYASYYIMQNERILKYSTTYIVPEQNFNWTKREGNLNYGRLPFNNSDIMSGFGFVMNADNTGIQQYIEPDSFSSSTFIYTWNLLNNRYHFKYYADLDDYQHKYFCDTADSNCVLWRQREIDIIAKVGDQYIIKMYQEYDTPWDSKVEFYRGGYIGLFDFTEL